MKTLILAVRILLTVFAGPILAAEAINNPELLNSKRAPAELMTLWKAAYPEMFKVGADNFFPDLYDNRLLYTFQKVDVEIQSGRHTGRQLAEDVIWLNKTINEFLEQHPGFKPPPELNAIKLRVSFEAYSVGALKFLSEMVQEQKKGGRYPSFTDKYQQLMSDEHFTKKEELRRVKAEFDEWTLLRALVSQLFEQKTRLQSELDGFPNAVFKEQELKAIGTRIQEVRLFASERKLDKSSSEEVTRLVKELEELAARFQKVSATFEASIAEQKNGQTLSQATQSPIRSRDTPRVAVPVPVEDSHGRLFETIAGLGLLITFISMILHAKKGLVFFGNYTDAAMTFAGPLVSFISATILLAFGVSRPIANTVGWCMAVGFACFGFKWAVAANRNPMLAVMAFISKYFLSVSYLIIIGGLLTSGSKRRKGEEEEDYQLRREREERSNKIAAAALTVLTAFLVRYLVKERRFLPLSEYFAFEWPRQSDGQSNHGADKQSKEDRQNADGGEPNAGDPRPEQPQEEENQNTNSGPEFTSEASPPEANEILGVSKNATEEEIKAAYRQMMRDYHPDKVAHLGKELRELAEEKAKKINLAYKELMQQLKSGGVA